MAIIPSDKYPGKTIAPSSQYPLGQARNVTTPGDGTGTPWEADLVNDLFGFLQSILSEASITATGNPDIVGNSQYTDAINKLIELGLLLGYDATLNNVTINGVSARNADLINSGTFSNDRLPATITRNINNASTTSNNGTFNSSATVQGVSVRSAGIINSGTFSNDRLPTTITRDIDAISGAFQSINFGQNFSLDFYESGNFTPTFNGAPNATTINGRYIRIGVKVDVFVYIEGIAAQRPSLPGNTALEVGNIPYISELTTTRNGFVSVVEEKGTYFYENDSDSRAGFLDTADNTLKLYHYNEFGRVIKDIARWSGGDFIFRIHASFIVG